MAGASLLAGAAALRLASLDLCADEYVLALARRAEVASLSRLAGNPHDSLWWRRAQGIPANRGTLESALAHRPTHLVLMGGATRASEQIARRLRLTVIRLAYPQSPADVAANLDRLATALGDSRRASGWRERLTRRSHPRPLADATLVSGRGRTPAADGLAARWLALAGYRQQPAPGGRLTFERLRQSPPARLILTAYRADQRSRERDWAQHRAVRALADRTTLTDGRAWTCMGPPMLEEIAMLGRRR